MPANRNDGLSPSELVALFKRCIDWPRATHYQGLCGHIGRLMLDLPTEPGPPVGRWRNTGDLYSALLQKWVLTVLAENTLAAMLLLDALDYLTSLLDSIVGKVGRYEFPTTEQKKRFTKAMRGALVEFEVPPGWELRFAQEKRLPGFRGVAAISRCHLSQDFVHRNDAISQLAGVPWDYETDVGYFDIRCEFFPDWAVVDDQLQTGEPRHRRELGITIPYTFILHEIDETLDGVRLIKRPTDAEVLGIARQAIDRLVEKASGPGDIAP
jgi:hypothetical protein